MPPPPPHTQLGVLVCTPEYSEIQHNTPAPCLRLSAAALLNDADIAAVAGALRKAAAAVLGGQH